MEEQEDAEVMMAENPPLPEEMDQVKKVKGIVGEEVQLGEERVEGVLVGAPKAAAVLEAR